MAEHKCAAKVCQPHMMHSFPCSRKGIVHENGEWWCKQHAPSSVAARDAKRNAAFNAGQKRRAKLYDRAARCEQAEAKCGRLREALLHAMGWCPGCDGEGVTAAGGDCRTCAPVRAIEESIPRAERDGEEKPDGG